MCGRVSVAAVSRRLTLSLRLPQEPSLGRKTTRAWLTRDDYRVSFVSNGERARAFLFSTTPALSVQLRTVTDQGNPTV